MKEFGLIRFDGFELNPVTRTLTFRGQPLSLNSKTFELLAYLAEHPYQIISKDQLMAALWPDSFVEESNLTQQIFLLRRALATTGKSERIVLTVPGKGYQFAASIESSNFDSPDVPKTAESASTPKSALAPGGVAFNSAVSSPAEDSDQAPPDPLVRRSNRSLRYGLLGFALVLLLASGGSFLVWQRIHARPTKFIDLVLSDMENRTQDRDFDHTLNQALQIDLEQSPYLHLLSRSRIQETLTEMQRKSDDPLTPTIAAEVCERNNALVMLHGLISQFGNKYLLILDADSCVTGKQVAGYKAEVSSKEEILSALDTAAEKIRRQLGESAASLDEHKIPISQATTPSLEALRAYSEASESFRRGDMKASQVLLERAIAADPSFASAYRVLGSSYYNLNDFAQAATFYKKAFELRDRTTERERLGIEIMYYGYALNDYEESIRRTRQFLQIYPNVAESWVSLANQYTLLGQYPQAIDAAEGAHRLDPSSGIAWVELARAYLRANRFKDAKNTASAALAEGKDHWDIHSILFQIAFAEHDSNAMKAEGDWGLTHQHISTSLYDLALAALSEGRLRDAISAIDRARANALREGDMEAADGMLLDLASILTELEEPARASALMKQRNPSVEDPEDIAFLQVSLGQPAPAGLLRATAEPSAAHDTVKEFITRPILRTVIALKANRPAEALRAIEPARPYQLRDYSVPYWRAQAETQAGMLDAAAKDYQLILDNPGVNPISPEYSLAHLRLARILSAQGKNNAALAEYKALLAAWKSADNDFPLLLRAREECAKLIAVK